MGKYKNKISIFFIFSALIFNSMLFSNLKQVISMADQGKNTPKIKIGLKLINGTDLPKFLVGATPSPDRHKYILGTIENFEDRGVYLTLDAYSPNNRNLGVEDFSIERIPPIRNKIFFLIYAGVPSMHTSDEEAILNYKIKKIVFKG